MDTIGKQQPLVSRAGSSVQIEDTESHDKDVKEFSVSHHEQKDVEELHQKLADVALQDSTNPDRLHHTEAEGELRVANDKQKKSLLSRLIPFIKPEPEEWYKEDKEKRLVVEHVRKGDQHDGH